MKSTVLNGMEYRFGAVEVVNERSPFGRDALCKPFICPISAVRRIPLLAATVSSPPNPAAPGMPAEDPSLCTVEIYGDSIMAINGTAVTPAMMLQLVRPNLLVVADHSVQGMRLLDLGPAFP